MIYKRYIFLRVKSKHVSAIYGHHQVLCQLRFHYITCVNCVMMWRSQHQIIVELYLCIGGYRYISTIIRWGDLHIITQFTQFIQVSHELRSLLRESVPYVKIYRYNPKHLYPKLNGYGDNGKRNLKVWQLLHTY